MDTDLALLTRYHRQRDAQAFQSLVESHAAMVHATARRVTQDAALAQDAAQEAFLALARHSGAAIQCVGAWLHQAAWRKACMLVRSEVRRQGYEAAAAEHLHTVPDATWAELEPVLDEALAELPDARRQLLVERFLEGRTQQEIAARVGMSQSTVSRQIDRGITELQAKLKSRGVIVSATGLAALLGANAVQALAPPLVAALGKMAISGVGTAAVVTTAVPWITSLFMKASITKIALATAAVLGMTWAGYDLASPHPKLQIWFGTPEGTSELVLSSEGPAASRMSGGSTSLSSTAVRSAPGGSAVPPATLSAGGAKAARTPFSMEVLGRFSSLGSDKDFKEFMTRLQGSGDLRFMAAEIQRVLGLEMSELDLAGRATSPAALQMVILTRMAHHHPEETLAWLAGYDGNLHSMASAALGVALRRRPDITAESIGPLLPQGPGRELVLNMLRAQHDPLAVARQINDTVQSPAARRQQLWALADVWPKDQTQAGAEWALQNLSGQDLATFLPRIAQQISSSSPDDALALLARLQDPALLTSALVNSMHGLVHEHRRMDDVLQVIDRLEGKNRAYALAEISRRWIRVDQEGLLNWINSLESPADFEATLPLTLPQLAPDHYRKVMDKLMTHLDPGLEAALIKSAMPDMDKSTRSSVDIIRRLTSLPQYQGVGSGQSGNQDLLWQAVNRTAKEWVQYQGALPQDGARWIDSLPFRSPADKAEVADKLYQQWKLSDPATATQWATGAGVAVK